MYAASLGRIGKNDRKAIDERQCQIFHRFRYRLLRCPSKLSVGMKGIVRLSAAARR